MTDVEKRVTGAPGTALKLRLEISKRASNIGHELFQRFFNGMTDGNSCGIFNTDLYRNGRDEFHLHFDSVRSFCATFRADIGRERRSEVAIDVWVRNAHEDSCPCASIVRLQPLDCCDMVQAESFEIGRFVTREFLWRIADRKLGAVLDGASIEDGKLIHEVIEGNDRVRVLRILRRLRIEADNSRGIKIIFPKGRDNAFQVRKMFFCPVEPIKGAIKWVDSQEGART